MGGAYSWIQKQMGTEEEVFEFPDTLEEFGYRFNEEGKLRSIETDEPYVFEARKGQHSYNQKRYNALGDVLTEHIYKMMEKDYKLQRAYLPPFRSFRKNFMKDREPLNSKMSEELLLAHLRFARFGIPVDAEENEPQTFAFISGDLYTNEDKLLILIHGSGAVRAGQWARRLIINDSLDMGSQLPYIKWARDNGYAVIVANTNINTAEMSTKNKRKKEPIKIRGNSSPGDHVESLWHEFVQRSRAKNVAIVAHSFGGVCTLQLAMKHIREFEDRVFAIALTDSVHSFKQQEATPEVKEFYLERAVNWASAYDPLDAPLQTEAGECPTISAGTDRHENTSYCAMQSIFTYFTEKYDQRDPAKKRVSMGEPQNAHYHRPSSSESQHLMSRSRGEGEESTEQPVSQATNQNAAGGEVAQSKEEPVSQTASQEAAKEISQNTEIVTKEDGQGDSIKTEKSDNSEVKLDIDKEGTDEQGPDSKETAETINEVKGKSEL